MISSYRSMSFPLFALIAALAGCSGEAGSSTGANVLGDISSTVTTTGASTPSGNAAAQPTAKNAHHNKRHSHRRTASLVRTALRAPINLSAEQRSTIEGLLKSNKPGESASASQERHVRTFDAARAATLAAAIRSNSVESIPAPAKQVKPVNEAAREARIAASASKLQTLHDTLTPAQRVALVDAIEARANVHGQKNAKAGERVEGKGEKQGDRVAKRGEGRKNGLFAGLDLTQAQKDALHTKLASMRPAKPSEEQREAMKVRFTAMRAARMAKLETFKGDSFDAKSFVTPVKQDKPVAQVGNAGHVNRRAQFLAALTSVLEPAQREKLATRIEQGPAARMQVKSAEVAN